MNFDLMAQSRVRSTLMGCSVAYVVACLVSWLLLNFMKHKQYTFFPGVLRSDIRLALW